MPEPDGYLISHSTVNKPPDVCPRKLISHTREDTHGEDQLARLLACTPNS